MKVRQKDKIFQIVTKILGDKYSEYEPMRPFFANPKGERNGSYGEVTENMWLAIKQFKEAFNLNEVNLDAKYLTDKYLKNLILNWLEKDPRLNGTGGVKKSIRENIFNSKEKIIDEILKNKTLDQLLELNKISTDKEVNHLIKMEIIKLVLSSASQS